MKLISAAIYFLQIRFAVIFLFVLLLMGLLTNVQAQVDDRVDIILQSNPEMIRQAWMDPSISHIFVVAHRANSTYRNGRPSTPENSLQGIENAIRFGIDVVEVDLKRTSDGHFILMHDQTVNRTTNGIGRVSDMTLEQIQDLNLFHAGQVTDHKVPTLVESLEVIRGRVMINLDHIDPFMEEVLKVVKEMEMLDHAIVKSRADPEDVVHRLQEFDLDEVLFMPVITGHSLITRDLIAKIENYDDLVGISAVELIFNENNLFRMSEELFSQIYEMGVRVWINTLWNGRLSGGLADNNIPTQTEEVWGKLIDRGATIVQTDQAAFMRSWLTSPAFLNKHSDDEVETSTENDIIKHGPTNISLMQNYPNPFNTMTKIPFRLHKSTDVTLDVYNIAGQHIITLEHRLLEAGKHTIFFDGSSFASGIYLYRLKSGQFVYTRSMSLIK